MTEALLDVRVAPRASRNRIVVEGALVRVYVTAAPADGQANAAVVALLAKALRIGKTAIEIVSGASSRDKKVRVAGVDTVEVLRRLAGTTEGP